MLIILGGLPGSGKTSVARTLARRLGAIHIRVDTIEQALRRSDAFTGSNDHAGYVVAFAVAEDNLRLGRIVVADSVNPVSSSRDAWLAAARNTGVSVLQVELFCSNAVEHRRRVETRVADIEGLKQPSWNDVVARNYEPWNGDVLKLDTATLSVDQCADRIVAASGG